MTFPEEITISCEVAKTEKLVCPGQFKEYEKQENYFTLKVYKKIEIRVYKPLITLKLGLFLWYAASLGVLTFFSVFFKQRGFTIEEFSLMYTVSPILVFLYTALLGVLADKTGQAKSILLFNILLNAIASFCLIFMPNITKHHLQSSSVYCHSEAESQSLFIETICGTRSKYILVRSCNLNCSTELIYTCDETDYYDCKLSEIEIVNETLTKISNNINESDNCLYRGNISMKFFPFCDQVFNNSCPITCEIESNYKSWISDNRTLFVVCYMIIQFVFLATFINIFRFFDITTVALSKEHNSNYGRERIWCTLGRITGPILSGIVIQLSRLISGKRSYDISFYLFIALMFFISIVVCKTDIRGTAPGKQMCIKTIMLIRNPDVLIFVLIIIIIGTVWGFQSSFKSWFLEDLGANPFLIGSLETAKGAYGLPFLYNSEWIVSKLSYRNVFILAIIVRSVYSFAYSFLNTAWPAFLIELTGIFGFHLFYVAVIGYAEEMAPQGITATAIVVAGGLHFTIGRITGSLIGGTVMSNYGVKSAFQVIGSMCIVLLMIYFLYLCCKPKNSQTTKTADKI